MSSLTTTLTKIQTIDLPVPAIDKSDAVVITDAIRATGLGPGARFYFDPASVEILGVLLAFGEPVLGPKHEARFTRAVRRPSTSRESLEIEIPTEGLRALNIDAHVSDSEQSTELSVWAGSQLLGFGINDSVGRRC